MSKLLDVIKRQQQILKYQQTLNERHHYRFYNEADEETGDAPINEPAPVDGEAPVEDPAMGGGEDPMAGADLGADDMGGDDPMMDPGMGAEEDPTAGVDDLEDPMAGGEDPLAGGEQDTEIDVTELVNGTQEVSQKADSIMQRLEDTNGTIQGMMQQVGGLEGAIQNMNTALASLTRQVELLRPPTEAERRKALAKDSYPFNVSMDDYNAGVGPKTQTDLEGKTDKLSFQNLLSTYNKNEIKDSF